MGMNEDDKIRQMFSRYNPPLSVDWRFVRQVESGLDSVEAVRERVMQSRKRSRVAVVVAALAGFVAGAVCTAVVPQLTGVIADWEVTIPAGSVLKQIAAYSSSVVWVGVAAVAATAAMSAFNLTEAVLHRSGR